MVVLKNSAHFERYLSAIQGKIDVSHSIVYIKNRERSIPVKNIVGISEIVLWTADKEQALHFYHDLLGLEVISPPTLPNVFLKAGEGNAGIPQMIVLVPKTDEVKARPSGFQLHHLAFELPESAFDTQHAALVAAGYKPRGGVHPVLASHTMYIDDPDGNEVEFICRASAS
jgi:catechol-2,3-dioxygenase